MTSLFWLLKCQAHDFPMWLDKENQGQYLTEWFAIVKAGSVHIKENVEHYLWEVNSPVQ